MLIPMGTFILYNDFELLKLKMLNQESFHYINNNILSANGIDVIDCNLLLLKKIKITFAILAIY